MTEKQRIGIMEMVDGPLFRHSRAPEERATITADDIRALREDCEESWIAELGTDEEIAEYIRDLAAE